ncbi:MAG: HepT-like ribonuclease domain-containing protein [Candidatus Thorarchaeota archaeon]
MEAIGRFVQGLDYQGFVEDDKTSSAVLLKFQIIGEAAKNIPNNIRDLAPKVPWKEMAGMRDRLVHAYFGVDYRLVWNAIQLSVSQIKPEIFMLLQRLED